MLSCTAFPSPSTSAKAAACPLRLRALPAAPAPVSRRRSALAAQKQSFGSFDEMIQGSQLPVLVDFYATWCGPCQLISANLSEVSKRMEGRLKVVKVDTEKYGTVATKYNVQALPTLVLFKNGKQVDRIEGLLSAQQIYDRVDYFLRASA